MPFDGNGNYSVPPGTEGVPGEIIDAGAYNAFLADLTTAFSGSMRRDGQSAMAGNLPMGGNKLTGVADGVAAQDAVTMSQLTPVKTSVEALAAAEVDLASAATISIGTQSSNRIRITGSVTISSFGTSYKGPAFLRFAAAVEITPGAALLTPYQKTMKMEAGDTAIVWPKATTGTADGWVFVPLGQYYDRLVEGTLGQPGTVTPITADTALNSGLIPKSVFAIQNTTGVSKSISPGSGVTLRMAGSVATGTFTLGPYGIATVFVTSSTEYVISGVL